MKVAIYARVSTSDKEQNPDTQLLPLRDLCSAQGWEVYREYVDQASASDLGHRKAWREIHGKPMRVKLYPPAGSPELATIDEPPLFFGQLPAWKGQP